MVATRKHHLIPAYCRYVCSSFIPSLPRVLCLTGHISSTESTLLSGTLLVLSSENPFSGVLGETVCDVEHLLKGLCSLHASDLTEPPASGQGGNRQQLSPEKCHVVLFANCHQSQVLQKLKVAESWNCRMSVAYTYLSKEHTGRRKKNEFFFSVIPEFPID